MKQVSIDGLRRGALVRATAGALAWLAATATVAADSDVAIHKQALLRAHEAMVGVHATALDDAQSIPSLGRERRGSGVLIGNDGLVLTIGYLILEADHVDLWVDGDHAVPARVVGYDLASGFGLLQALAPVHAAPAKLGSSATLTQQASLLIASGGAAAEMSLAHLVSQRPFSGYWEYHLDAALFTAPPRLDHSGAALFNTQGELMGIGSLIVVDALGPGEERLPGNMFVPIDLLKPILAEMRSQGASRSSTRPWLGLNCVEEDGSVRIVKVTADSPAALAGLQPGDQIVRLDGADVRSLESFYKTLWRADSPEHDITLDIQRDGQPQSLKAHTLDRLKTLSKPQGI